MPYSYITIPVRGGKKQVSSCLIEKTWKLILCAFECYVLLNSKAPCCKNVNISRSKNYILGIYDPLGFLSMPHSCITRQSLDIKTSFSSSVIENDVKVNIMPFRTLSSIEFQGSCSRDFNLRQSENCIFGIYDQFSFRRCLTRTSLDLSRNVKSRYFQLSNRKNVKVNIMRFRILCSIEFQSPLLQKLELITVWNYIVGMYGECSFCRCLILA
jgi:hypothetical protein